MDPLTIAAAIGAGSNLLGGFLGRSSAADINASNTALQREFAQNAIQWKVADAKKAGVHPLYALGAPTMSFAPNAVGAASDFSDFGRAGQDISRALMAGQSQEQRGNTVATALTLENMKLRNDVLRSQLMRLNGQIPPPAPSGAMTEDQPFRVPQDPKVDGRPPIMVGGSRIQTDPGTSPAKTWEDWLGDDVFSPGFIPNLFGAMRVMYGEPSTWPRQAMVAFWNRMSNDVKEEYGNFNNLINAIQRRRTRFGRPYEDTSGYSSY